MKVLWSIERPILQKRYCLKMDCIDTYYNPVKNMMIKDAEKQIGYGLRRHRLREDIEDAGNHVMYYLREAGPQGLLNGPDRAFVSEELMLIPQVTELPPDYVQEW